MIPSSDPVRGGKSLPCWDVPKDATNSPNIFGTDLPRLAACVFASATSMSSIRKVNFAFMARVLAVGIGLVKRLFVNNAKET